MSELGQEQLDALCSFVIDNLLTEAKRRVTMAKMRCSYWAVELLAEEQRVAALTSQLAKYPLTESVSQP